MALVDSSYVDQFSEKAEDSFEIQINEDNSGLTLRTLVSTKEAGVIIGKGR